MTSSISTLERRCDHVSLLLAAMALLAILWLHLLPALFAGLVAFVLIHAVAKLTARFFSSRRGKLIAVGLMALMIATLLAGATLFVVSLLKADAGLSGLLQKMATVIENAGHTLPALLMGNLPSGSKAIQSWLVDLLRTHSAEMQNIGKEAGLALAHVLVGLVIGSLLAFHEISPGTRQGPLAMALLQRVRDFLTAFRKIVLAQLRISLLNTIFTGIYLMIILPLTGTYLPFSKTMVGLTFLFGLLPVVGNLMSNTIIVTVSASHTLSIALTSLGFLILIHKLEYFLNARIVGTQIKAKAWELLLSMLVMEAIFGIAGLVAAPVYYAYLKNELLKRELI